MWQRTATSRSNPKLRRARGLALVVLLLAVGCDPTGSSGDLEADLDAIRALHTEGRYRESLDPLRALLEEHPDEAELHYRYGIALTAVGQDMMAIWSMRKAMKDPEWAPYAGAQLAYAALVNGNFNETIEVVDELLETRPDSTELLLMRAQAHAHWRSDPEAALRDAERVLELNPDEIGAMEPKILALLQLERHEEATKALDEVGDWIQSSSEVEEGTRAWHCATRAVFASDAGDDERAHTLWEECRRDYPGSTEVVWPALDFYGTRNRAEESVELLREALEANGEVMAYRTSLSDLLLRIGRPDEGEAVLAEAMDSERPSRAAEAAVALGRYRQNLGEYASAAEAYATAVERAGELGPVPAEIEFGYADALVLAGRLDEALEMAEELEPRAHRHAIRARVHQERGEPAKALEEYDETFRLWPDNPWAHYYAALAAEQLGQFQRAVNEYRASIRINAGATDARTRLANLLLGQRRLGAAFQVLRSNKSQPLSLPGQLLALRLAGMQGDLETVEELFADLQVRHPEARAAGVTSAVEGVAFAAGPETGLELLRVAEAVDFDEPGDAQALQMLVQLEHEAGRGEALPPELASALEAHPEAAAFQEALGLHWELAGREDEARAAYQRALERQPGQTGALLGLGRLALDDAPARALEHFEAAAAAGRSDPEVRLGAARALAALGRHDEALQQLDAQLRATPESHAAAALYAEIDLQRGSATERTLERARRAAQMGGGPEALELLSRVHSALGDEDEARKALAAAETMRDERARRAGGDGEPRSEG